MSRMVLAFLALAIVAPVCAVPAGVLAPGNIVRPNIGLAVVEPQVYVLDQYLPGYLTQFTGVAMDGYSQREVSLANQAVWVDRDGWIYLARYNGPTGTGIDRYAPAGGGPTTYATDLKRAMGVAVDSKGRIYIADADLCQIIRIDNIHGDNRVAFGRPGSYLGEYKNPCGVFVDKQDRVYVADTGNSRLVAFNDMNGNGWTVYDGMQYGGVAGQVINPWTLWVDDKGRIYYLRPDRSAVCRIDDISGKGYISYGVPSVSPPYPRNQWLGNPQGVAVDHDGRIYLADQDDRWVIRIDDMTGANRVELFQANGKPAFRRPTRIFVAYPKRALVPGIR